MLEYIQSSNCEAVIGYDEYTYQRVLDDFSNTKFIGIITYNISSKINSSLLNNLKIACNNGTNAVIFTNIPKRFPSYYGIKYALAAKEMINKYKEQLNPCKYGYRLNTFFSCINHAKVILTDNIVYWGSSNFSDESSSNIECGTISTDKKIIDYFKNSLFPKMENNSIPYYKDNFIVAIANLFELISICKTARQSLFNASFQPWSDYDTHFEETWIYCTTNNGLTSEFLEIFIECFSKFEDALNVIDNIIDEYCDSEELPDEIETLKKLFEDYNKTYDIFNNTISSLFAELEQLAKYDEVEETNRKLVNNYGMEAFDENLDYYAEKAANEVSNEYQELINNSKSTVNDALETLDEMVQYFEKLYYSLLKLLKINSKIDNTSTN